MTDREIMIANCERIKEEWERRKKEADARAKEAVAPICSILENVPSDKIADVWRGVQRWNSERKKYECAVATIRNLLAEYPQLARENKKPAE